MTDALDPFIATAHALADAGGAIARRYYRTPVTVDDKADSSPVTIADREAEAAMRAIIAERHPGHGIIGEEHGREREDAEHVWVLDPIDGTKSFITGRPLFGGLIGLFRAGRPILGVIDCPALGERWIGAAGRPTLHQGQPVRTRACPGLAKAVLLCTAPEMFRGPDAAAFERVRAAVRLPMYGGDCFLYGQVASGFADLAIERGLKTHDFAALIPVIEGAGGLITDWSGAPLTLESQGDVIAAGDARTHAEAVRRLAG